MPPAMPCAVALQQADVGGCAMGWRSSSRARQARLLLIAPALLSQAQLLLDANQELRTPADRLQLCLRTCTRS